MRTTRIAAAVAAITLGSTGIAQANPTTPAAQEALTEYEEALKLEPNLENGRKLFRTCTICHAPEGWGSESGSYPQIAGQLKTVIVKQLADIRARNRDNPTMYPFTERGNLGGPQDIMDVAAYIESLPMNPRSGQGPGMYLAQGEKIYRDNCAECHGDNGEGDVDDHIPALYGQHYRYLVRQFEWIRVGKRRNSDEKMVKQIQGFTAFDVHAVMDYVSRLQPPAEKVATPGWTNPDFPHFARRPWRP